MSLLLHLALPAQDEAQQQFYLEPDDMMMTSLHLCSSPISWVGYSQPGFEGQQHILEEGEYLDCSDWSGSELLSLRPILSVSTVVTVMLLVCMITLRW